MIISRRDHTVHITKALANGDITPGQYVRLREEILYGRPFGLDFSCILERFFRIKEKIMGFTQVQEPYLYVVVRKDLSTPQKAVQACHAVFEAVTAESFKPPQVHPNVVLCEVKDERRLVQLAEKLEKAGVKCALFQEPDIGDRYTSLATEIIYDDRRFLFKNLQLMQEKEQKEHPKCACEMVADFHKGIDEAYAKALFGENNVKNT